MELRAKIAASLLLVVACGAPPREQDRPPVTTVSVEPAPQPPAAWELRVDTFGGYIGVGKGRVEITSDSQASSEDCKATTLRSEAVEQAVLAARPEKWTGCYRRATFSGMTDQFSYQLRFRVERDGQEPIVYETSWQDDSVGMRPADLSRLAEAAWQAHKDLETRCSP